MYENCHFSNNLYNYIRVYENNFPIKLCDEIINEYDNTDLWVDQTQVNQSNSACYMKALQISADSTKTTIERKRIDQDIFTHLNKIITKYNSKFPFLNVTSDTGYILLKYSNSDFYKMHVDDQSDSQEKRTVSCVICLTDDYIGGEIAFLNKQKIFKLKKGDVLLFPSNFMFPHEVYPIVSGVRYSIVTWFR